MDSQDFPRFRLSMVKIGYWSPLVPSLACNGHLQFHHELWPGLPLLYIVHPLSYAALKQIVIQTRPSLDC